MVCNCNVVKRNASEEFKTGTYLTVCAFLVAWQVCIGGAANHVDDLQSCFRLLRSLIGGGSQSSNIESVDERTRGRSRFLPSPLSFGVHIWEPNTDKRGMWKFSRYKKSRLIAYLQWHFLSSASGVASSNIRSTLQKGSLCRLIFSALLAVMFGLQKSDVKRSLMKKYFDIKVPNKPNH